MSSRRSSISSTTSEVSKNTSNNQEALSSESVSVQQVRPDLSPSKRTPQSPSQKNRDTALFNQIIGAAGKPSKAKQMATNNQQSHQIKESGKKTQTLNTNREGEVDFISAMKQNSMFKKAQSENT